MATYAIVAWRLMWLTYLVRPLADARFDRDADWDLEPEEWQALCHYYHAPPDWFEDPGLQQCIRWIAQLGGFWGRPSDGDRVREQSGEDCGACGIWCGRPCRPDAIAAECGV
jgi:hypothetical protein